MVKALTTATPTIRRFGGVLEKTSEKACIKLENNSAGILNGLKFEVNEKPVYGCACKKGLDKEHVLGKISDFCERIKDGKKLFEDIMKSGLNIK